MRGADFYILFCVVVGSVIAHIWMALLPLSWWLVGGVLASCIVVTLLLEWL